MRNLNYVLAELVRQYGIEVDKSEKGEVQLWWGAFTQGSGVTFNGGFVDFAPIVKEMFQAGKLDQAAKAKKLIDDGDISVAITRSDSRYTHAQTMSVDVSEIEEPDDAMFDALNEAAVAVKDIASNEAYSLLEDYLMLEVSEDTVFRVYTTRRFKVELIKSKDPEWSGSCLDSELEAMTSAEGLAWMREVTKTYQEFEAYDFKVVVYGRKDEEGDWQEIGTNNVGGGVYKTHCKFAMSTWRDIARDAITDARSYLGFNKALKEAA